MKYICESMTLPFELDVPIKGYQHHAYLLGALFASEPQAEVWIHNYYVQLQYNRLNSNCSFNFYRGEIEFPHYFFESECVSRETLLDMSVPIVEFVKYKISNNYYLQLHLDEYYVPNRKLYLKEHFWHDILIYGYSVDTFHVVGYDEHMLYKKSDISKDVLEVAFCSNAPFPQKKITSFRRKPLGRALEIDMQLIYAQLIDYVHSQSTADRYKYYDLSGDRKVFGLEACECLNDYLQGYDVDIRPFHILWEHKVCMKARMQYLHRCGLISNNKKEIEAYQEIVDKALILRNEILKVKVKCDTAVLADLKSKVYKLLEKEKSILVDLLEDIENSYGFNTKRKDTL